MSKKKKDIPKTIEDEVLEEEKVFEETYPDTEIKKVPVEQLQEKEEEVKSSFEKKFLVLESKLINFNGAYQWLKRGTIFLSKDYPETLIESWINDGLKVQELKENDDPERILIHWRETQWL